MKTVPRTNSFRFFMRYLFPFDINTSMLSCFFCMFAEQKCEKTFCLLICRDKSQIKKVRCLSLMLRSKCFLPRLQQWVFSNVFIYLFMFVRLSFSLKFVGRRLGVEGPITWLDEWLLSVVITNFCILLTNGLVECLRVII